ncbi:MAG: hypothetical protein BGO26_18300 [Actinobacteria bacterium 69-20]|jgi:hypothetical protein|nr:MAG: hypothetical protein BGO26_18300 [Actinobacteria bacterium 69-20]
MPTMDDFITLDNGRMTVLLDVGRGADILSVMHVASGVDVMFSTPWRSRADAIRAGRTAPSTTDPTSAWLEGYRGGWQTLCPNAGPPRTVEGAPVGFHGEAALTRWDVCAADATSASLQVELYSVPVRIDRTLALRDDTAALDLTDTVTNLSDTTIRFDYAQHPALAGPFLAGDCHIDTGATHFTTDPDTAGNIAAPGTTHTWPFAAADDGTTVDLRIVPSADQRRMAFGWLSDFTGGHWASVTNRDLGLTARFDWDGTHLPYAWFWQELNDMPGYPWYRRARVLAIEPASTQTSGPDRRSVLALGPDETVQLPMTFSINEIRASNER